ncbi:kinase-like domain-containing protein [Chaetomium tenue]|uniref:Kinase-like domain-containing protein n=1 Tax=Chaetomium tenue TaxID=1854479 RepID=A0ACB7PKR7_9PEZI|nr:kinase-like domain-containing protein [Chaetomium globosum]
MDLAKDEAIFQHSKQQFDTEVRRFTRTTPDGRSSILTNNVVAYLEAQSIICPDRTNLDVLYSMPVAADRIKSLSKRHFYRVFCILLQLGAPNLLPLCCDGGIVDANLPVSKHALKRCSGKAGASEREDEKAAIYSARFYEEQYRWLSPLLDFGFKRSLSMDEVLPLHRMERINPFRENVHPLDPDKPTLWKIQLPEEFVCETVRGQIPHAKVMLSSPSGGTEPAFEFAPKQFPAEGYEGFRQEARILGIIGNSKGFVRYIGRFDAPSTLADGRPTKSWNILLELGQYDLDTVLHTHQPPQTSAGILRFWESILPISSGLVAFHNAEKEGVSYLGWHGDVKPENIVSVHGSFKLVDPGESIMLRAADLTGPHQVTLGGRTITYGCPELGDLQSISSPVTQACDVWSLGCVLSVAATFVIRGSQGNSEYTNVRTAAAKRHTGFAADIFHDGTRILSEVAEWHRDLRKRTASADIWTGPILTFIDTYMLVPAEQRVSAREVADGLTDILSRRNI